MSAFRFNPRLVNKILLESLFQAVLAGLAESHS